MLATTFIITDAPIDPPTPVVPPTPTATLSTPALDIINELSLELRTTPSALPVVMV